MGLADCPKCWDCLCSCGWEYRNMTLDTRMKYAAVILGVDQRDLEKSLEWVEEDHPLKGKE